VYFVKFIGILAVSQIQGCLLAL